MKCWMMANQEFHVEQIQNEISTYFYYDLVNSQAYTVHDIAFVGIQIETLW